MNKYKIDYEYGVADFYTEAKDEKSMMVEFYNCASHCFGIRKSVGECKVIDSFKDVQLPIPYRDKGGTHFLSHNGDNILFDSNFKDSDDGYWKLLSEHGEWCSCAEKGREELSCEVHHFYVKDHDKKCKCLEEETG